MKRLLPLLLLPAFLCWDQAAGQFVQARFVSSAYGWQRYDTVGQKVDHLYGFQNVQLSVTSGTLSFNTHFQGFNDFSGPLKNDPTYRLYNISLKARSLFDMVDVQAGRFFVFAGAGTGSMDGGLTTVRLPFAPVKVTGYYGLLTPPGQKAELIGNAADNTMLGIHVVGQPVEEAQVSVSYAKKTMAQETYRAIRADSATGFIPYTVEMHPAPRNEELFSGDANIDIAGIAEGYVRYDYDLLTEKSSRFNAFGRMWIMDGLAVTGEYLQREPRISFNSIFSAFAFESLKETEGGVEFRVIDGCFLVAKYGTVSYGDESSNRITLAANGRLVSASVTRNVTYDGEISAANVNMSYPLLDNLVTPSLLVSYASYKFAENAPLDNALSLGAGALVRPLPSLSVDAQVQWISNPIVANDVRVFLRASYLLNQRFDLF